MTPPDSNGIAGGVERLREYLLLRCDQNERAGGKHVRFEIADVRRVLATTPDPTVRTGEEDRETAARLATEVFYRDAAQWDRLSPSMRDDWFRVVDAVACALPLPGEAS